MTVSLGSKLDGVPDLVLLPSAVAVSSDDDMLHLRLADGRELSVPLAWFPPLLHATPEQRAHYELSCDGEAIYWSDIDVDISVASLLGLPSD